QPRPTIPSIAVIKSHIRKAVQAKSDTTEFARCMRVLAPSITVLPYQLLDGGAVVLRAKVVVTLTSFIPGLLGTRLKSDVLEREIVVDLFDQPQREAIRTQLVQMRATMTEREAAKKLKVTITAAQRSMVLQRMMDEQNLTDPYVLLRA